jgi:hypothetical protein
VVICISVFRSPCYICDIFLGKGVIVNFDPEYVEVVMGYDNCNRVRHGSENQRDGARILSHRKYHETLFAFHCWMALIYPQAAVYVYVSNFI